MGIFNVLKQKAEQNPCTTTEVERLEKADATYIVKKQEYADGNVRYILTKDWNVGQDAETLDGLTQWTAIKYLLK